jgi:Domain of unknown function (DUF4432)
MSTHIELHRMMFDGRERPFLTSGELTASLWRYDSGVEAVRIRNAVGEIVMLPFKGQQIWSAEFGGRTLTMRSMFDEPRATDIYLDTYGAFLIHCGMTAMGVPGPGDRHPLHGEMPNARYDRAFLTSGTDALGAYIGLGGLYRHVTAFKHRYRAEPMVKLYAGSSVFSVDLSVTNEKHTPMELMYLAHANFRPVDGGQLAYTAQYDAAHVRVRQSIPSHIVTPPGYRDLIAQLAADPTLHHTMRPGLAYDPEAVFAIDPLADHDGWFHAMQLLPDGSADYLGYRRVDAPRVMRWLTRTPDQDGLGIAFPATAGVEGKRYGRTDRDGPRRSVTADGANHEATCHTSPQRS